jgi:ketosteroid isomerase-like protein
MDAISGRKEDHRLRMAHHAFYETLEEYAMQMQPTSMSALDTLLELNREYIRSVQNSDVQRFTELLAEDFLCSNPDGSLVDREHFLEQTAQTVSMSNLEAHDVVIRIMGDFAIIHARTTYIKPDGSPGAGRYTDIWAHRNGHWRAISAHVTRC